jgi:hypothetical protein
MAENGGNKQKRATDPLDAVCFDALQRDRAFLAELVLTLVSNRMLKNSVLWTELSMFGGAKHEASECVGAKGRQISRIFASSSSLQTDPSPCRNQLGDGTRLQALAVRTKNQSTRRRPQ